MTKTINQEGIGFGFTAGNNAWVITCPACTSMEERRKADAVLLFLNGDTVPCDSCGQDIKDIK